MHAKSFVLKIIAWLKYANPIFFVLIFLAISYLIVIPFSIFSAHFYELSSNIGKGPNFKGQLLLAVILGCVIAPVIETLFFQFFPIRLSKSIFKLSEL
jgi:hypothetical protein